MVYYGISGVGVLVCFIYPPAAFLLHIGLRPACIYRHAQQGLRSSVAKKSKASEANLRLACMLI
jgi:hypothetical protein